MRRADEWRSDLEAALDARIVSIAPLSGGCVGEVHACALQGGRSVVVKVDRAGGDALDIEAYMLRSLAARTDLPVPRVLHHHHRDRPAAPALLVLEMLPGSPGAAGHGAERHAAELLGALHGHTADAFGLERDTLIGGLRQPNGWMRSWVEFFRERRLLEMARQARDAGRLPARAQTRVEACAHKLGELIGEPQRPALIHGDVWSGNVLCAGDRVTGFIDPAICYAHPEVELAFITLFSTFGRAFFERYAELRPIEPGFFETRRDAYNLYPLLVHARLFGGAYVSQLEGNLSRLGF